MFNHRYRRLSPLAHLLMMLALPIEGWAAIPQPSQAQTRVPMEAAARRAAAQPIKIDVRLVTQTLHVDDKISIDVVMLDANNQPATWNRPCQINLGVTSPTKKTAQYSVKVLPGQSSARTTFVVSEPGLFQIRANEANNTLLPGGNSFLVSRAVPVTSRKKKQVTELFQRKYLLPHFLAVGFKRESRNFEMAAETIEQAGSDAGQNANATVTPQLLLVNSSGKDEILADGEDFARIQVFYMDPLGGTAPSRITIWLTWSNGRFGPQPLIIEKGQNVAEGEWTSLSPVNATLALVGSAPRYEVNGGRELKVSFAPPIYGIAPSSPGPLKISLIDCEPLVAQFFDRVGHTVQTSTARHVTFISSNPSLHLDPSSSDVPPNGSEASIFLVPTWIGSSKLDIWTPGYDHQTLEIQVSMWTALFLCLGGGLVGGIAAREAFKGGWVSRLFTGVLGGIVLVWVCVYAVLPQTHSIIAHSLVSVFVVGIVGGYGGTKSLDFVGKRLGVI